MLSLTLDLVYHRVPCRAYVCTHVDIGRLASAN